MVLLDEGLDDEVDEPESSGEEGEEDVEPDLHGGAFLVVGLLWGSFLSREETTQAELRLPK